MPSVFGVFHIELRPGVKGEDLEKLYTEEIYPLADAYEGMEILLLKGDKGARAGKYVQIITMESVEERNRLWGSPKDPPGSGEGRTTQVQEVYGKVAALAEMSGPPGWTDYVVVDK